MWFTGTSSSQGLTTVLLEMILKTFHKHYYLGVFLFSTFYALVNFLMLTNKIKDTLGFFFNDFFFFVLSNQKGFNLSSGFVHLITLT